VCLASYRDRPRAETNRRANYRQGDLTFFCNYQLNN
jgi:hypothetical protein